MGAAYPTALFLHKSNKDIVTTEYRLSSSRVPQAFKGIRMVNVSDLQSQYFGRAQSELLEKVRKARPDIILMTGDILDRNHTDKEAAIHALTGLLAIAPVYYTNGNHELALKEYEMRRFYETMKEMGVHMVMNDVTRVERGAEHINIIGVSEETLLAARETGWGRDEGFAPEVLESLIDDLCAEKDQELTILLSHEPQYIKEYSRPGIDFIFSGHAHGGQFRLPGGQGLFSPGQGLLPKLTSGIHRCEDSVMIISRGLGNSVFPFRLNNRPEIVVVTLE